MIPPDSDSKLPVDPTAPTIPAPPAVPPRPSMRPVTAAPRTKSGQHPAVTAYRGKLVSIQDGQGAALDALAAEIERATEVLKTPLPPPPLEKLGEIELEDELTPTSH